MVIPKTPPGSPPSVLEKPTAPKASPPETTSPSTVDEFTPGPSTPLAPPGPSAPKPRAPKKRRSTARAHASRSAKSPKLVFIDIEGGPVKPITNPENIPANYRTVRFEVDGMRFQISGMAAMTYNKELPRSKLLGSVLPATNVKNYVNLQKNDSPEKVQWEMRGGTYTFIPMTGGDDGFNTGKIKEFERFYLNVTRAARKGQNSVVHCGEGWGRTGTMLASLKLREIVDKKIARNPAFAEAELAALKTNTYTKDSIDLGKYSSTPYVDGPVMVIEAIRRVRAAPIEGEATKGGDSVEVPGQVQALTACYFHLLRKASGKT